MTVAAPVILPAPREHPEIGPRYIPALDGLRGIAILLVLIFHGTRPMAASSTLASVALRISDSGWMGVDLFFVLSGFLITGILLSAKSSSAHYFKNFYARRSLRIFPLYYGILAIVFTFGVVSVVLWRREMLGKFFIGQAYLWTYTSNFAFALIGEKRAIYTPQMNLAHFWSLAIEEQFYLFWPAVIYLLPRRAAMVVCALGIVAALIARIAILKLGGTSEMVYFLTPCRLDPLLIGGLLALHLAGRAPSKRLLYVARAIGCGALLGLIALVCVRRTISEYDPAVQTLGFSLLAFLFAALVTIALNPMISPAVRLLQTRPLRALGQYSYGLYAFHYIVLSGFCYHFSMPRWAHFAGGSVVLGHVAYFLVYLTATITLAVASYHLFEIRFLKLKSRFA